MQQLLFNLSFAIRSLRSNALRTGITVAIITLGITALVGILTATDVMKAGVSKSFSALGANSFQITNETIKKSKKNEHPQFDLGKNITFNEAYSFQQTFDFPNTLVGISCLGTSVATIAYQGVKTNPNITVMGADQNYFRIAQTNIIAGRAISAQETSNGNYVCVLGFGVAKKLFSNPLKAIDKTVIIGATPFQVVGVAEEKGGGFMMNADNLVIIPLQASRQIYNNNFSYGISVLIQDVALKQYAADEAEGAFRIIRKLPLGVENNFKVRQNDNIIEMFNNLIGMISGSTIVIALITLLGSVIGLMNIMLVSVVERTKEIGIAKALGAKSKVIRQQFLIEALSISLLGGIIGIILSLGLGLGLAAYFDIPFSTPWNWMITGITVCTAVGIGSGYYPAKKAAQLDPIVALRTT